MISVLMYLDLPQMSRSGKKRVDFSYEAGMRAADILNHEFSANDHDLIMVVVNGEQKQSDILLSDGDTVELLHPMVGGGV